MAIDYSRTEIQYRSYLVGRAQKKSKKFLTSGNSSYVKLLKTLPTEFQREVFDWIRKELDITNAVRQGDVVGDIFELAGIYFMAHQRNDYLLSLVAQSYEIEYGREDLEAAILWEQLRDDERKQCPHDFTDRIWLPPIREDDLMEGDHSSADSEEVHVIFMVTTEAERQRYIEGNLTPPDVEAPEGSPAPEDRVCIICNEACANTEHIECMTCQGWTHVRCCRPIMARECEICQLTRFHYARRDAETDEERRFRAERQRISERSHPLLLSTGQS